MNSFLNEDFLLSNEHARSLYHQYAKDLPIIDYHNHLPPQDIANNRQFKNLTQIWLEGDHYKWRAMRTMGINERFITGDASDTEKFEQWAYTVPYTMRNPLYHWTHLELKRYFGIKTLLSPESAKDIYDKTSKLLTTSDYTVQSLLTRMNVEVVCTTDDPTDSLEFHQLAKNNRASTLLLPTFRPDKSFAVESPATYKAYLEKLSTAANTEI